MELFRSKVVGTEDVVEEKIKKERATKNTLTQIIERRTVANIVLDCGHKIPVTHFNKVPSSNTHCIECERAYRGERTGYHYAEGEYAELLARVAAG